MALFLDLDGNKAGGIVLAAGGVKIEVAAVLGTEEIHLEVTAQEDAVPTSVVLSIAEAKKLAGLMHFAVSTARKVMEAADA